MRKRVVRAVCARVVLCAREASVACNSVAKLVGSRMDARHRLMLPVTACVCEHGKLSTRGKRKSIGQAYL